MNPVYIIGTGAMGCLWGQYLSSTSEIIYITRDKHRPSTRILCESSGDHFTTQLIPANVIDQGIQRVIVATKAFDALGALESIRHRLSEDADILLLQNGMGAQQRVASAFSSHAVYACSSTEGAYKTSETSWIHAGKGENQIGAMTAKASLEGLRSWLPPSLFHWQDDISLVLWRKLLVNAAINPLTVIHQCQNGQLLSIPEAAQQMSRICGELDELVNALALPLPPSLPMAQSVCEKTAKNFSSMYQDHVHGRRTEIEYITGYVLQQCKVTGVACPTNEAVYTKVVEAKS